MISLVMESSLGYVLATHHRPLKINESTTLQCFARVEMAYFSAKNVSS